MLLNLHTTGIHYTDKMVEWAVLRKNRSGIEKLREGMQPIPAGFFDQEDAPLFPAALLEDDRKNFSGVVTVSLPSSRLLMRVLELPSVDPDELKSMVELQADQMFPFPVDQLTVSYEVLHRTENHSRVLAVAAPRKIVDALGELFKEQNIYIRSLDAEILAWWSLLSAKQKIPPEGRVVVILEEHTEFSIIVVDDGVPVCFRSLELFHDFTKRDVMQEIIEEIRYTLLSLEAEYGHRPDVLTEVWSEAQFPAELVRMLEELSQRGCNLHGLDGLPSLSEGLALRSADRTRHHAELVPREWVELQRRRQIMRAVSIASVAVLAVWLAVISIAGAVFAFQTASFKRVEEQAKRYAGPARAAQDARAEKESLEKYAERSRSALECLREVTALLPDELKISSFSYSKGKETVLRGSAEIATPIFQYFQSLGASELFKGIKNERQETLRSQTRPAGFTVTIILPPEAAEDQP